MPFEVDIPLKPFENQAKPPEERPGAFDQAIAALDQYHSVYNAASSRPLPTYTDGTDRLNVNYDVWDRLTEEERGYANVFVGAKSDADVDFIRKRIDTERKNKAILRDGPLNETLLAVTSGFLDPSTYLPVFGPLTKVRQGALALGASAVASAGLTEAALQSRQYERSAAESWASMLIAAGAGSALGAAVGAWAKPMVMPKDLVTDVGGLIRSTGLAGREPLRADLMSTTAVARFLDIQPRFRMEVPTLLRPEMVDILNGMSVADAKFLTRVNNAADEVDRLTARLSQFDDPSIVQAGRNAFDGYIAQHKYAQQRLAAVEREAVTLDPVAQAEQRARIMAPYKEVEAMAKKQGVTLSQAFDLRINQIEAQREQLWGDAAQVELRDQLGKAVERHDQAQRALLKAAEKWRGEMNKLSAQLGTKGRANAYADILRIRDEVAKHLDEGGDILKVKQPNPLDWLKGIAKNPTLSEPDVTPVAKAGEAAPPMPKGEAEKAESLSAAAVPQADPALWKLASSFKVAQVMAKLKKVGLAAPSLELGTSIFSTSNRAVHQIVDTGMLTEGNLHGFANPKSLHSEMKRMAEPDILATTQFVEAGWKDYIRGVKARGEVPMKKNDFYRSISYALRRGDKSSIKEVEEVAAKLREIDNKYRDLMIEWDVGVFKGATTEEVAINPDGSVVIKKTVKAPTVGKTAESHYLRSYNDAVLRARQADFLEMATDYFERQMLKDAGTVVREGKLVKVGKEAKDGKPATKDEIIGVAGDESDPRIGADFLAQEVYHTILSHPESRIPFEIKVAEGRGAAKERTFKIRDDFVSRKGVKFEDFLDNNPINVMSRYIETAASDVAYQMTVGGDEGLAKILKDLQIEADAMAKALPEKASSTRIVEQYEREAQLIRALVDATRGVSNKPVDPRMDAFNRTLKGVRSFQALRNLGSVILSQLPDLGTATMSEGFSRIFAVPIADMITGFKGIRMGVKQAQMFGTATDVQLMGRAGQMFDLAETYREVSRAEMLLERGTHFAMNAFGIGPWTASLKGLVSYVGGHAILDGVERLATGKPISEKLLAQLARDGIGPAEAKIIYAERDNWVKHNGLWLSGAKDWKNIEARNLFGSALLRRVDNAIITPNVGDAPLWTSQTEIGKSVFQFKRFAWASNQRLLIGGLQQRDHMVMTGLAVSFGMAMLGTAMRDISTKGKVDENRSTAGWIREAVDRSGWFSQGMEIENVVDKATGGHGPVHMLTGAQPNRFAASGLLERVGGPSVGMLADTSRALSGIADGSLTGSDVHNLRRLLPAQNYLPIKNIMDQLEESVVNHYGLPPRQIR
jgi:hypothetical protein